MDIIESKQNQLKSILKPSVAESSARSQADAREIAIAHAKLLQHRKDLETEILDSLILLSEYPLVREPSFSAANPAPSDISGFKTHVRLFQPSDYDDLIEERNVNELCGYSLCPRPKKKVGGGGKWKLTGGGDIVRREQLERWCSAACAKRALFVKVQLNETAAWERAGIPDIQIDLLEEDQDRSRESEADRTTRELGGLRIEEQRQVAEEARALALERGDGGVGTTKERVKVMLRERETTVPTPEDVSGRSADDYLRIDGYRVDLPSRPKDGSAGR